MVVVVVVVVLSDGGGSSVPVDTCCSSRRSLHRARACPVSVRSGTVLCTRLIIESATRTRCVGVGIGMTGTTHPVHLAARRRCCRWWRDPFHGHGARTRLRRRRGRRLASDLALARRRSRSDCATSRTVLRGGRGRPRCCCSLSVPFRPFSFAVPVAFLASSVRSGLVTGGREHRRLRSCKFRATLEVMSRTLEGSESDPEH